MFKIWKNFSGWQTMRLTDEFKGVYLGDERLNKRLITLAKQFETNFGKSISYAAGDWSSAKAAYRFFDNDKVDYNQIISPHFSMTRKRVESEETTHSLVVHDTTECNYTHHNSTEGLGYLSTVSKKSQNTLGETQGFLMHTSLAVGAGNVPLGLLGNKIWVRDRAKKKNIRSRKLNYTRVPVEEKESYKWLESVERAVEGLNPTKLVHVCDRDADMYELFCRANELNTNFLIRGIHQRCTSNPKEKIYDKVTRLSSVGSYDVDIQGANGRQGRKAKVHVRYYKVRLVPPVSKSKRYDPIDVYIVSAKERKNSKIPETDRIDWRLITNMEINSFEKALEKIRWYQARWCIEEYFKVLKSGMSIDKSRLRSFERMQRFIALISVIGWRVFWLSKVSRSEGKLPASLAFTRKEQKILSKIEASKGRRQLYDDAPLKDFVIAFSRLGGYLARKSDPPPGPTTIWRAFQRLADIAILH